MFNSWSFSDRTLRIDLNRDIDYGLFSRRVAADLRRNLPGKRRTATKDRSKIKAARKQNRNRR